MKGRILFIVILSILLLNNGLCVEKESTKEAFPSIDIPVYPDGYSVKIKNRSVFYKVNTKLSDATKIISFYDKQFRKMGFIPYSEDGYGKRRWENFNPKTGKWEKTSSVPARFIATWIDKEKTLRAVLLLRYKYNAKDKEWDKKLLVNCTIYKFFDFREMQDSIKSN